MKISQKAACLSAILNSRIFGKRTPLAIGWELTYKCNSNCLYCRTNEIRTKELPLEKILQIINDLKSKGCQLITYTGGECMLRPDFGKIIRHTKSKGIYCGVVTNGRIVPERIDVLRRYVDNIQITIDGRKEVNDYLRSKGSYDAAINALRLLRKTRIKVNINMVLCKYNIDISNIKHVLDIAKKYNAGLSICPMTKLLSEMHEKNKWEKFMENNIPLKQDQDKVIRYLLKEKRKGNKHVNQSTTILQHLRKWPRHDNLRCVAGRLYARISPDGQVYPCNKFFINKKLSSSNAAKVGFKRAWQSLKPINCRQCWFNSRLDFNYIYNFDFATMKEVMKFWT